MRDPFLFQFLLYTPIDTSFSKISHRNFEPAESSYTRQCEVFSRTVSLYMDKRLIWFEKLYDTYADAIWRHLYAKVGDRERAKELMQEVFMKTWQYVMLDKTIEHEKAFLYRIARNLFINEIRTNKETASLTTLEESGYEIRDEGQNSASLAHHKELMDRLDMIKQSYRDVLIMRYIDDLPVKEIAEILNENETNISMRIKRGIEALKMTYEPKSSLS